MPTGTVLVNQSGTKLSYIDSGAPSNFPYITVIAVHGISFTNLIFKKVQSIFLSRGIRFVAFNRRNYPGSSPYTPEELAVITGGTSEQKDAWMEARGHEIAIFIDTFSQTHNLPPISHDGKSGGIVLLGWSLGASFSLASISSACTLSESVRSRLSSRIRALIAQEPAPMALGLPTPEKNWVPLVEQTIPPELRLKAFSQWVTSYFEHGDLSKRDLDSLSYVLPSTIRPPSIFNMSKAEINDMILDSEEVSTDLPFLFTFGSQLKASYCQAFFDPATAELFPHMKLSFITGDLAPAWGPAALWAVQDDDKEIGKGRINFMLVPGVNHFMHWDDPEKAVSIYMECAKI